MGSRTTVITAGLVAFLAGLGMARLPGGLVWLAISVLSLLMSLRFRKLAVLSIVLACGISVGFLRGITFARQLSPYQATAFKKVTLEVRAQTDAVYDDKKQLAFDAGSVRLLEPVSATAPGRLKVSGFGERVVYRGDVVRVSGRMYPGRGSWQGFVSFADMRVVSRNTSYIDGARLKFVAGMQTALPEPLASFGLGLLVGQRSTLPEALATALSAVGLTHIIAVSGYNLTILVRFVRRVGRSRSKYQLTVFSVMLIMAFLLVTGLSASIVRAALVSVLSLWAWYYGREFRPILLLALAAALTAAWSPLYLWSDIGWYLSFLAFFGVMVLSPLVARRLHGAKRPNAFVLLLYECTAAQVMTLPLILYIFQEMSLVAVASNLLVVPLVPVAMACSLLAGLGGVFTPLLAGWLALPARVLLTYMLDMVGLFARVPYAVVQRSLPVTGLVLIYGSLLAVSLLLWRSKMHRKGPTKTHVEL